MERCHLPQSRSLNSKVTFPCFKIVCPSLTSEFRIVEALSTDYELPEPPETPSGRDSPTASLSTYHAGSASSQSQSPLAAAERERPRSVLSMRSSSRLADFEEIKQRLAPLLALEDKLIRMLSSGSEDDDSGTRNAPNKEVYVRSNVSWKAALSKLKTKNPAEKGLGSASGKEDMDDPSYVMSLSKADMITLWREPFVREVLEKRKMRLEESSGL